MTETLTAATLATLSRYVTPGIDDPPRLFSLEVATSPDCTYPNVAPATGYRYGCRCDRCRMATRPRAPSVTCHMEGCDGVRLKQRKVCIDHLPRCGAVINSITDRRHA